MLATRRDGFVDGESGHGLFVSETRLISKYRLLVDGKQPAANVLSNIEQHSWMGYYVIAAPGVDGSPPDRGSGQVPLMSQQPLEIRVTRVAADDGVREDIDITNFARQATRFELSIELDADFADIAEGLERVQHGKCSRTFANDTLRFHYHAEHEGAQFERAVAIRFSREATFKRDAIRFAVSLEPHEIWHLGIAVEWSGGQAPSPVPRAASKPTTIEAPLTNTLTSTVTGALRQAAYDLRALRLYDLDSEGGWTVGAGLPLYVALYGRDALTSGWQAAMLGPEMMRGILKVLADNQGTRVDDWRDEQPGRMLHEVHTGPLSALNFNPRARSYSSLTTSGLYAFIAAELWHWTGDKSIVEPFIDPALKALAWLDQYADLDGDGLYEYQTRSSDGVRHQGWKDSPDAIVYEDGTQVDPPIATCEEQGFAYIAKLHMSETLWWLGRKDDAKRLFHEASELKKRFNEAFWMEDEGFYAMALDSKKRPVRSIGSNAGHCIATSIADSDLVERAVDRLFAPDLFSGWGVRTLSCDHPAFNPYSYHLGSVWPVEHGTFALGFMRYGLHDRTEQIARAQFEAAALFDFYRLPELFSGHARDDEHPFPAVYPNANTPQAWSASMVFCLLQAMLGLYPYAPLNLLIVDPHLPEWLPEITIRDMRVGKATVTIRFRRKKDGSSTYSVLRKRGKLHVVRQPTPWSLTTSWAERLVDTLKSLL